MKLLVVEFDIKDAGIECAGVVLAVDFGLFAQPEFERDVGHPLLDERGHLVVVRDFLLVDFEGGRIGAGDGLGADGHSARSGRRGQRRLGHLLQE